MHYAVIYGPDGLQAKEAVCYEETEDGYKLTLPRERLPLWAEHVDFCPELFRTGPVEGGYLVIPCSGVGFALTLLRPREDTEYVSESKLMPILGFSAGEICVLAVVTGMAWDCGTVVQVRDGIYSLYERFEVSPGMVYEDLQLTCYRLPAGSGYSDMARRYRMLKLEGGCVPLRERADREPALRYLVQGPEVRIRLAWKPVPSPVEEQTPENEPPVHVACTFERAEQILERMKAHGVDQAQICLVGWNIGGHDGRWMQHFPVEEKLGGEVGLRKLIRKAHSLGYQIVGHSNVNDSYTIAEMWQRDDMVQNPDGSLCYTEFNWGGGRPYQVCPRRYLETVERDYPRMAELGFHGVHYVDVLTILPPRKCWSSTHHCTSRDTIEEIRKVMTRSRELFGGFSSEGGLDHTVEGLDFALYTSFKLLGEPPAICDRPIPFWQLVYHGIVLHNPSSETVNYGVKDTTTRLKFIEYGGRPVGYFHSKFLREGCNHWMGSEDLTCGSDQEIENSAAVLGEMYREYRALRDLQYLFMEKHEMIAEGVFETTYSDGTVIRTDYRAGTYQVNRPEKEVPLC